MSKVETYFEEFVSNISPSDDARDDASTAHTNLRDHLSGSDDYKDTYSDSFLYGSYRRFTAIYGIDDVDICILVNVDHLSEEGTPRKVLGKLKKAISKYYRDIEGYDEDNTGYNRRSILVKDALPNEEGSDLTLDVIPAIQDPNGPYLLVPDREKGKWVNTNPLGHVEFSRQRNADSSGQFIKVVKLFKHLKKYHIKAKHPKGFWIETLVGVCYEQADTIAESFYKTLLKMIQLCGGYEKTIPSLPDVGMDGETIKTAIKLDQFLGFMKLLKDIKDDVKDAIDSSDKEYSVNLWRYIFGEEYFPVSLKKDFYNSGTEEFITRKNYIEEIDSSYSLNIECTNLVKGSVLFSKYRKVITKNLIQRGSSINDDQCIKFEVKSDCPEGTEFLWKVRNYGSYAGTNIRGEIGRHTNQSTRSNEETIAYIGIHTVECFATYEGKVIAKDLFKVQIIPRA